MSKKKKKLTRRRLRNGIWFENFGASKTAPCHWCKKIITFREATLDHEPPLAEGGKWKQAVIACHECNHKRGEETAERLKNKRGNRGPK